VRLTAAAQAGKTIFVAPRERNSAQKKIIMLVDYIKLKIKPWGSIANSQQRFCMPAQPQSISPIYVLRFWY